MKDEHFRKIIVPLNAEALRAGLDAYVRWYDEARPHSTLGDETPSERLHCRYSQQPAGRV